MPLPRYVSFNLVGLLGAILQLTTLALLNHLNPHHYLLNSAAALEFTLLHNIVWHIHYTWRDRPRQASHLSQIARFHLSNGLISLLGNLALMHLFVREAHAPVVVANAIAIVVCSFLNFVAADVWTFQSTPNKFKSARGQINPN